MEIGHEQIGDLELESGRDEDIGGGGERAKACRLGPHFPADAARSCPRRRCGAPRPRARLMASAVVGARPRHIRHASCARRHHRPSPAGRCRRRHGASPVCCSIPLAVKRRQQVGREMETRRWAPRRHPRGSRRWSGNRHRRGARRRGFCGYRAAAASSHGRQDPRGRPPRPAPKSSRDLPVFGLRDDRRPESGCELDPVAHLQFLARPGEGPPVNRCRQPRSRVSSVTSIRAVAPPSFQLGRDDLGVVA